MEPGYPLQPLLAFLALLAVLVPLPWHWEASNTSTVGYMVWSALGALNVFVNMIVWHNNARNPAPIWCDISAKFQIGFPIGISAASLAINRRLYRITSVAAVRQSDKEKRRDMIVDLLLVVGAPILVMAGHVIVQGHLGNIYEDFGCSASIVNTWAAVVIVDIWPLVFSVISSVYCGLVLRSFLLRRLEFNEFISTNCTISFDRYWRLMMLSMMDILITFPLALYTLYSNFKAGLVPYVNWAFLHSFFQRWAAEPRLLWKDNSRILFNLRIQAYLPIVCGVLFFMFFGLAQEARGKYKQLYWRVAKVFGIKPPMDPRTGGMTGKLASFKFSANGQVPVFAHQPAGKNNHSASFLSTVGDLSMDDDLKLDVEKAEPRSRAASSVDLSADAEQIDTLPVLQQTQTFTYIDPPPKALQTHSRSPSGDNTANAI